MKTNELLFELSHSVRYEIMKALATEPRKLSKLGELVGANNPEVSRHLDRLKKTEMVDKDRDGLYFVTNFGKMAMAFLPYLSFITTRPAFFKEHDLSAIPSQFLLRLGELSSCEVVEGATNNLMRMMKGYDGCRKRICSVTNERWAEPSEESMENLSQIFSSDLEFREIVEEGHLGRPELKPVLELCGSRTDEHFRAIPKVPLFCTLIDDETAIAFLDNKGTLDFSVCFWSSDPEIVRWSEELIDHLWEGGKKI